MQCLFALFSTVLQTFYGSSTAIPFHLFCGTSVLQSLWFILGSSLVHPWFILGSLFMHCKPFTLCQQCVDRFSSSMQGIFLRHPFRCVFRDRMCHKQSSQLKSMGPSESLCKPVQMVAAVLQHTNIIEKRRN